MAGAGAQGPLDTELHNEAIERAAARGAYWSGSRLFVALSAMLYASGTFAYFYLHGLDSSGLWRTDGQQPSDYVSVPVRRHHPARRDDAHRVLSGIVRLRVRLRRDDAGVRRLLPRYRVLAGDS